MPWIIMMSIYFLKPLLPKSKIILLQAIKLRKRCISSSSISIIMYHLEFTHPSWYMIYEFGSKQKCLFILFLIFSGLEKFKGYEKINISPFIIMMHRMQWQKIMEFITYYWVFTWSTSQRGKLFLNYYIDLQDNLLDA